MSNAKTNAAAGQSLLADLLGSSGASDAQTVTLARYDAQIAHLSRLISVGESMSAIASDEDLSRFDLPGPKCTKRRGLGLTEAEIEVLEAQVAQL